MLELMGRLLKIEPQRLRRILLIGVPIIGSMLSQSLINLIDAAMVGRLGEDALAAVGIGSYASFVIVSTVMGLSAAVQALVARRIGEDRSSTAHEPLMAGLLFACLISLPLSALAIGLAPQIMGLLSNDQQVVDLAIPYFQWRSAAMIAIAMNFVFRGYWSGISNTRLYLNTLVCMHLVNIGLSYLLIFGIGDWTGIGMVGSGIGTAMSLVFGTAIHSWITFIRHRDKLGDIQPPNRRTLIQLGRLAWPNSAQQTLFAFGISVMFWIIGQVGTEEQAVGHILISLQLVLILPAVGMGIASTSLVSQSLGAKNKQEAYRWGWEVVRVATCIIALLGIPLWLLPELLLSLFTNEQHLIDLAIPALRLTGLIITFEVTALVLTQALLGAGASRTVMTINTGMQWLVLLPVAWLIGPVAGFGLFGIWLVQGLQRVGLSVIYSAIWYRRGWAQYSI